MLNLTTFTTLLPINRGEHALTADHPSVISDPSKLVVDRAVKSLLTALQGIKLEIGEDADGIILNLGYTSQGGGPNGLIRVAKATGKLQYYDIDDTTWKDIGSGGGSSGWPTPDGYEATDLDTHLNDGHVVHQSYGVQVLSNASVYSLSATECLNHRVIEIQGSSCALTLPGSDLPDGARISIFPMGSVTATLIASASMVFMLPGSALGYASIENTAPAAGDCITLRNHYAYGHWLVESLIGTWGEHV